MCLLAREPWIKLPIYALAQTLGAFLGAGIVFGLYYGKCGNPVSFLRWDNCVCDSLQGGRFLYQRGALVVQYSKRPPYCVCGMAFPFSWWCVQASPKQSVGQPALSKCKSLSLSNEPLEGLFGIYWSSRKVNAILAVMKVLYLFTVPDHFLILGLKNEVFTVMSNALSCVSFQIMWLLADFAAFIRVIPYLGKHLTNPVLHASISPVCFSSS